MHVSSLRPTQEEFHVWLEARRREQPELDRRLARRDWFRKHLPAENHKGIFNRRGELITKQFMEGLTPLEERFLGAINDLTDLILDEILTIQYTQMTLERLEEQHRDTQEMMEEIIDLLGPSCDESPC